MIAVGMSAVVRSSAAGLSLFRRRRQPRRSTSPTCRQAAGGKALRRRSCSPGPASPHARRRNADEVSPVEPRQASRCFGSARTIAVATRRADAAIRDTAGSTIRLSHAVDGVTNFRPCAGAAPSATNSVVTTIRCLKVTADSTAASRVMPTFEASPAARRRSDGQSSVRHFITPVGASRLTVGRPHDITSMGDAQQAARRAQHHDVVHDEQRVGYTPVQSATAM